MNLIVNAVIIHNYPFRGFIQKFDDKLQADPFTAIYVGNVSRDRGYQVMVAAMQIVKDKEPRAQCVIVGPVNRVGLPQVFLSEEKSLLKEGGIEFVGRVPYEAIPQFLLKGSIGWFPLLPTLNYLKATPI